MGRHGPEASVSSYQVLSKWFCGVAQEVPQSEQETPFLESDPSDPGKRDSRKGISSRTSDIFVSHRRTMYSIANRVTNINRRATLDGEGDELPTLNGPSVYPLAVRHRWMRRGL